MARLDLSSIVDRLCEIDEYIVGRVCFFLRQYKSGRSIARDVLVRYSTAISLKVGDWRVYLSSLIAETNKYYEGNGYHTDDDEYLIALCKEETNRIKKKAELRAEICILYLICHSGTTDERLMKFIDLYKEVYISDQLASLFPFNPTYCYNKYMNMREQVQGVGSKELDDPDVMMKYSKYYFTMLSMVEELSNIKVKNKNKPNIQRRYQYSKHREF